MYPNVQDGCQLTHEEGSCCPQLVCTGNSSARSVFTFINCLVCVENVAKKLASVPEIHDATLLGMMKETDRDLRMVLLVQHPISTRLQLQRL
jgi:hypothetical protein